MSAEHQPNLFDSPSATQEDRLVRAAEDRYRRQSKPDESNRRSGDESVRSILRELKNLKDLAEK